MFPRFSKSFVKTMDSNTFMAVTFTYFFAKGQLFFTTSKTWNTAFANALWDQFARALLKTWPTLS